MNKKMKSLILGATMIMALPIIGGCGSNTIGYVDSQKVVTQTAKSIEINKEINAKGKELQAKIDAADEASKAQVTTDAKQDFNAFTTAKNQELKPKKLNTLNFHKIMLKNFKKMKEFQKFTKKLAENFLKITTF